ncbi:hypothetical protein P692DRAFT_20734037, partial [Suillus brevipes Sb2]
AIQPMSALVQDCPLQKTWCPHVPCAERCNRTWNNRSLIGQGSNSATCRICRVSRRRSGHVISRAVGRAARKPFCLVAQKKQQPTIVLPQAKSY